ncbi:MAG: hypothetical protein IIZ39_04835, partial [Blautia sp.]|nr:hypothetical protein [Blautia sp.]
HVECRHTEVRFPLSKHHPESICNLVYTIYTRGSLLSKATGGVFSASEKLVDTLKAESFSNNDEAIRVVCGTGSHELVGLKFEGGEVVFDGFPGNGEDEEIKAWKELCQAMNKASIKQHHIQAKKVDETNEKFAFRTWLTRLGMNGPELKAERQILYRNLSGRTAFRTTADEEKWKTRQAKKRQELREKKEEEASAEEG